MEEGVHVRFAGVPGQRGVYGCHDEEVSVGSGVGLWRCEDDMWTVG